MKASGSISSNRENLAKVKKIDWHTKSSITYFQRCCVRGNSCIKTELAKEEKQDSSTPGRQIFGFRWARKIFGFFRRLPAVFQAIDFQELFGQDPTRTLRPWESGACTPGVSLFLPWNWRMWSVWKNFGQKWYPERQMETWMRRRFLQFPRIAYIDCHDSHMT